MCFEFHEFSQIYCIKCFIFPKINQSLFTKLLLFIKKMTSTSQINQWFEMYVHLVLFIKLCIHCINLYIINHFLLNINSLPEVIKNVMKKKNLSYPLPIQILDEILKLVNLMNDIDKLFPKFPSYFRQSGSVRFLTQLSHYMGPDLWKEHIIVNEPDIYYVENC